MPDKPKCRWYHLTPDRFVLGLLLVVGVLLLPQWFAWFPFNRWKGWTVLIAIGALCVAVLFLLLWFAVSLIFRRRFQFSIRSLLVFVLVCAVVCSWFAARMKQARRQREAVEAIQEAGGWVEHDYEVDSAGMRVQAPQAPAWLINVLGVDFFSYVVWVRFPPSAGNDSLEYLKGLTKLQSLLLYDTKVTDAGLEHLNGLTNLQWLGLSQTQVTDAGLEHLKALTNLQWLGLRQTQVTDAGLEHLKGLTNLQSLGLSQTQVTDAGLEHLKGLTNLQSLGLHNTKVTEESVQKLRQALPNCEIVH